MTTALQSNDTTREAISAYTSLLRFRKNGQILERPSISACEEASPFEQLGGKALLESFLDRVAQLFSKKKEGPYVTGTLLLETNQQYTLLMARNQGFDDEDHQFVKFFQELLREIAQGSSKCFPDITTIIENLWCGMVGYYKDRNILYRRWFKEVFKKLASHEYQTSDLFQMIKSLETKANVQEQTGMVFSDTILTAQKIARHYGEKDFETLFSVDVQQFAQELQNKLARELRKTIALLGRLCECWEVIIRAACELPNIFKNIIIEPLPVEDPKVRPQGPGKWDLTTTLKSISWLNCESATTVKELLEDLHVRKLAERLQAKEEDFETSFNYHQKTSQQVHAEIQLLIHASKYILAPNFFDYVGCSKLNCYCCHLFLKADQQFRSDGCHLRVFNSWRFPREGIEFLPRSHLDFPGILKKIKTQLLDDLFYVYNQTDTPITIPPDQSPVGSPQPSSMILYYAVRSRLMLNRQHSEEDFWTWKYSPFEESSDEVAPTPASQSCSSSSNSSCGNF